MVALCRVPGQQPTPQAISNVLLACAELSVPVKQADTDSLASFFLSSNRRHGTQQAYTNTAWSLAVTGHLRQAQFTLMLHQMFALPGSGEMSAPPLLTIAELTQLYQALDWLQPSPTAPAQQQSAWSSLQGKLHRVGPRPAPETPPFYSIRKLCAALNQLQLSYTAAVVIQSYLVAAVLQSQDYKAQPVILRLSSPDYISNIPGRSCTTLTDCTRFSRGCLCQLLHLHISVKKGFQKWPVIPVLFVGLLACSQRLSVFVFCLCLCALPAGQHSSQSFCWRACIHCRLTGRALFSTHLMAKQGQLVDVPRKMTSDIITVKQLADYLEPILTVAAGGSLHAYCL